MYDCNADCPSPSAPLVYVFLGVGAWRWTVVQRRRARTPDSGGAQAGGASAPFTVCAHSWFEEKLVSSIWFICRMRRHLVEVKGGQRGGSGERE